MTQEAPLYYQAALFPNKTAAGKAYDPIQNIIFDEKCDLSAYRFFEQNQRKWYVVVIGEKPIQQVHQRIETILLTLTRGERVPLNSETLTILLARRAQQSLLGPWVEHHYDVPDQE
jgi:hypothetical protein